MIPWLLLLCAAVLLAAALRVRQASGLPWARVLVSDTSGWRKSDAPLVSHRYGLVGQPDYLLATRSGIVPVEVKPGRTASEPYDSDLMQLAAYYLLVEDATGRAPRYGLLRYAAHTFQLRYTRHIRAELLELVDEMRQDRAADNVGRSHQQRTRCRGCGFHESCDERLA